MKKMMMITGVVLCLVFFVCAKDNDDTEHRAVAEELLTVMKISDTVTQTLEGMKEHFQKSLPMLNEKNAAKMTERLVAIMKEELSWEKTKEDYIGLYVKLLTVDEMKPVIAFYKTPVGQAFLDKQPEMMKQSMEVGMKINMRMMPKIQAVIQEALTEEEALAE